MERIRKPLLLLCFATLLFNFKSLKAQITQDTAIFNLVGSYNLASDFPFLPYYAYTALFDRNGANTIYAATNELGFLAVDISNPAAPSLAKRIQTNQFGNLKVTHLVQRGNVLYLALGGFQGLSSDVGLATVNVSVPNSPTVIDVWTSSNYKGGAAAIQVQGDYAYLGAMDEGLVVLNISDSSNIQFVSDFLPNPNFPAYNNHTANARGIWIKGNTLYLADDSGGLRLIDISNPNALSQISEFSDSLIWFSQPAVLFHNQVRTVGNAAFVSLDYCGLYSVDISNPAAPQTLDWYNPWNCRDSLGGFCPNSTWFGSPGHANELVLVNDSVLLMSGGDSELLALDISDPSDLRKMGEYVHLNDSQIVWGIDYYNGRVALAYVRNPNINCQPYYGTWGGIKILDMSLLTSRETEIDPKPAFSVFPNPAGERLQVGLSQGMGGEIRVLDLQGREIFRCEVGPGAQHLEINLQGINPGLFLIQFEGESGTAGRKFIKL